MAFDFDNLDNTKENMPIDSFANTKWDIDYKNCFEEVCDSLSPLYDKNTIQQTHYLMDKGYFIADKFYTVNPYTYMGLNQHQCHCYFGNGILFLYFTPDSDLKTLPKKYFDKLKIWQFNNGQGEIRNFDRACLTEVPVVIFQGNKNQIIGKDNCPYPADRSIWTASDLVIFRGVFKVEEKADEPENYILKKLFDRYYFGIPENKPKKK